MDVIIKLIPIMINFFIEIWQAFRDQTTDPQRLENARLSLEDAARRVREMEIGPPPERVNPHPLRVEVPNDGWLPENLYYVTNGRAVKLPKKD